VPLPPTFGLDLADKPPQHQAYKRRGRRVDYEALDEARLRRVIALYYGSITLVDDQVGKIVRALEEQDLRRRTIIVFTSDHGELLGHYGMLIKSIDEYPMLYDVGLHVPLVISLPEGEGGRVVETPVELIDLCPTLLDAAGLPPAPEVQGQTLVPALAGGDAPAREYVFAESGAVKCIRGRRYKLVYYPGQSYGELYDLERDPHETQNLYARAEHAQERERLTKALLDRLIHTEAPRHGESLRGPAYWRQQYAAPF